MTTVERVAILFEGDAKSVVKASLEAETAIARTEIAAGKMSADATKVGNVASAGYGKASTAVKTVAKDTEVAASKVKGASGSFASAAGIFGKSSEEAASKVEGATSRMTKGFSSLKSIGGDAMGTVAIASSVAVIAIGVGIASLVKSYVEWADKVRGIMLLTGASAQDASKLGAIFRIIGVDVDTGSKAVQIFARNLYNNKTALDRWFSSAEIARLKTHNLVQDLPLLSEKYKSLNDPLAKAAFLMDAFGRGGAVLRPMLEAGAGKWKEWTDAASQFGLILSDKDVHAAHDLEIQMRTLGLAVDGLKIQGGRIFAPIATSAAIDLQTAIKNVEGDSKTIFGKIKLYGEAAVAPLMGPEGLIVAYHDLTRGSGPLRKGAEDVASAMVDGEKAAATYDASLKALGQSFDQTFGKDAVKSVATFEKAMTDSIGALQTVDRSLTAIGQRSSNLLPPQVASDFFTHLQEMADKLGPAVAPLFAQIAEGSDKTLVRLANEWETQSQLIGQTAAINLGQINDVNLQTITGKVIEIGKRAGLSDIAAHALAGTFSSLNGQDLTRIHGQLIKMLEAEGATASQAEQIYKDLLKLNGTVVTSYVRVIEQFQAAPTDPTGALIAGMTHHTGGLISMHDGGLRHDERIAKLQTGEFVMQRKAVAHLGTSFLQRLNEMHDGGPVTASGSYGEMTDRYGGGAMQVTINNHGTVLTEREFEDFVKGLLYRLGFRNNGTGIR